MSELISMFSTGGIAGVLGLAGGILNRWVDHKTTVAKLKFKEKELQSRENELRIESETQLTLQKTQSETDIQQDIIAANTTADQTSSGDYRAALKADKATYSDNKDSWMMTTVDFLRGTVRIVVIYSLLIMVWLIASELDLFNSIRELAPEQRLQIIMQIVTAILSMAVLGVSFYFGNRPSGGHKA